MTEPVFGEYVVRNKVKGQQAIQRKEISMNLPHTVGIQISNGVELVDPTDITAKVYKRDNFETDVDPQGILAVTFPMSALVKDGVGLYRFDIPAVINQDPGIINVVWEYTYNGDEFKYRDYFEMSQYMPIHSALNAGEKSLIDRVYYKFADLYDSIDGGPHLTEEFQTKFGPERMAQLLGSALNTINYTSQPVTNYFVGDGGRGTRFPLGSYGILEWGLYIEIIKHLIRSYTEQPIINGAPVAYVDRRDYTNRWREVLRDEEKGYADSLTLFKRKRLNLGGGNLLVAGGMFGGNSAWTAANGYSVGIRGVSRWYPVSYVVQMPGSA